MPGLARLPRGRSRAGSRPLAATGGALVGLTLLTCAVGFAQKLPCRLGAWESLRSMHAYACHTDIYPLYFAEKLAGGAIPYLDYPVEYPVLIGAAMQTAAWMVSSLDPAQAAGRAFYDVTVVMLTVAALVAVAATVPLAGSRRARIALLTAAPGLAFAAYINWDLIAVAFTALAVWAWSRQRPGAAGVLLGLAVATKFYPIVLLGPLFLLCLRARRLDAFGWTFLGGLVTWVGLNLPVALIAPEGWAEFYAFSRERGIGWGSVWLLLHRAGVPVPFEGQTLNALAGGAFLVLAGAIAALALAAPRRPRLAQLAFLTLAAFILTNKVWSPQFVLWLLPFAVLARPRVPALLAWQGAWLLYFLAIWFHLLDLVDPGAGIGDALYIPALGVRAAAVLVLCALVVREVLLPDRDLVRSGGADDPAGGVLDRAPDRVVLRPSPVRSAGAAGRA